MHPLLSDYAALDELQEPHPWENDTELTMGCIVTTSPVSARMSIMGASRWVVGFFYFNDSSVMPTSITTSSHFKSLPHLNPSPHMVPHALFIPLDHRLLRVPWTVTATSHHLAFLTYLPPHTFISIPFSLSHEHLSPTNPLLNYTENKSKTLTYLPPKAPYSPSPPPPTTPRPSSLPAPPSSCSPRAARR